MIVLSEIQKDILGGLSVLIGFVAYGIYGWQTYFGRVRPHPLTWLMFAVVTGTGFWIQLTEQAGPGSWVMLLTAVCSLLLSVLSFCYGERTFPLHEWGLFVLACLVFYLYLITREPNTSAILATIVDVMAYGPTVYRLNKSPEKDSWQNFALNSVKFVPSIIAMDRCVLATIVYPATLIVVNGVVAALIYKSQRDRRASI